MSKNSCLNLSLPQARACGLPPDTPMVQVISDDPSTVQQMKRESPLEECRNRPLADASSPTFPVPKNADDLIRRVQCNGGNSFP